MIKWQSNVRKTHTGFWSGNNEYSYILDGTKESGIARLLRITGNPNGTLKRLINNGATKLKWTLSVKSLNLKDSTNIPLLLFGGTESIGTYYPIFCAYSYSTDGNVTVNYSTDSSSGIRYYYTASTSYGNFYTWLNATYNTMYYKLTHIDPPGSVEDTIEIDSIKYGGMKCTAGREWTFYIDLSTWKDIDNLVPYALQPWSFTLYFPDKGADGDSATISCKLEAAE